MKQTSKRKQEFNPNVPGLDKPSVPN